MKHLKVTNESSRDLAEVMPLLRVAYDSVKPEITTPPVRPLPVTLGDTRKRTWMCRWKRNAGQNTATLNFSKPCRNFHNTAIGPVALTSMNEVIVAVAAWTFASILVKPALGEACARDAVQTYRQNRAVVDGQIAAVAQAKKDKEGDAFAAMVFDGLEKSTLAYKLSQIEKKEKVWLRKFRLAETKLKALRRSRSALIAADKRKQQTTEAQVAAAALPPQAPTP